MTKQTLVFGWIGVFIALNTHQLSAQKPLLELIPKGELMAEQNIDGYILNFMGINSNEKYITTVSYPDMKRQNRNSKIYFFNINGSLLWQKEINSIRQVELAPESDKVIISNFLKYHTVKNVCFDQNGNKLWEITNLERIIKMAPGGKYGISPGPSDGDNSIHVFDLETGTELETTLPDRYSFYRARFIDARRVVFLLEYFETARDEEALKRLIRMRREGKIHPRTTKSIPNTWKITNYPVRYIIYDIPTQTILTDTELFSPSGEPLHLYVHSKLDYISISPDKQHIALVLRFGTGVNFTMVNVNINGEVKWETNERIIRSPNQTYYENPKGIYYVDHDNLLFNGPKNTYFLINQVNGNTLWKYKPDLDGSSELYQSYIQDNQLILQTLGDGKFRVHTLNFATGDVIQNDDYTDDEAFVLKTLNNTVIYNKTRKQLQFIKSEGLR